MARRIRIILQNGLYHVYNRGNYRTPIFESEGARDAFLKCLFEAAEEHGWIIHAFAIMRNHFHIALQITRGNLPESVAWLESTFSVRFNRFRKEHGHLFQGRYHALVVEPGAHLARLVNYLHLNPVRKNLVPVLEADMYRWSSLGWFRSRKEPEFMTCDAWMRELGFRKDRAGWAAYIQLLAAIDGSESAGKENGFDEMLSGWAIGSDDWKSEILMHEITPARLSAQCGPERDALRCLAWQNELEATLARIGKSAGDLAAERKGAAWKVAVALHLRKTVNPTSRWLAGKLFMGTPATLRNALSKARRA